MRSSKRLCVLLAAMLGCIMLAGCGTTGAANAAANAGSGLAASSTLSVSPSTLTFGSVQVGSTSSQQVTISNTGTGSAIISGVTVTGASTSFSYSGVSNSTTIPAGGKLTVTVSF